MTSPFGGPTTERPVIRNGELDFAAIQHTPEFQQLRSRLRRFVFPVSVLFLSWYLVYVLLAAYARSFMSIQLFGAINVGMVLGFLQFVSTAVITVWYVRFARTRLDPATERIRGQVGVDAE